MTPVHLRDLNHRQCKRLIRSFMFVKAKYDGSGRFDKVKSRLVIDGRIQDKKSLGNTSAPTAALESIFSVLKLACVECRKVKIWDVTGAFLNAAMGDEDEVHMILNTDLVDMILTWFPDLTPYKDEHGRMVVKLNKALYGLVQSALLWYEHVIRFLSSHGFVQNETDRCVLNKMCGVYQVTICLYIDDMLVTCVNEAALADIKGLLEAEYGKLQEKNWR